MANHRITVGPGMRGLAILDGKHVVRSGDTFVVTEETFADLTDLIAEGDLLYLGTTTDDPTFEPPASGGGSGAPASFPPFSVAGALTPVVFGPRMYALADVVVSRVLVSVNTAPAGAPIVLDLLLDGGTSIFGADKPTIAAGTHTDDVSGLAVPITAGQYLKLQVVSVGTTTPGSDLTIQMEI